MSEISILTWDWKEQPPLDDIADIIKTMSGGTVNMVEVDTGSDQFAWVISPVPMDQDSANEAYRRTYAHD